MEADLRTRLAALGCEVPERPPGVKEPWRTDHFMQDDRMTALHLVKLIERQNKYSLDLESALGKLAERLEASMANEREAHARGYALGRSQA